MTITTIGQGKSSRLAALFFRLLAVWLLLPLLLAGCGDDDSGKAASTGIEKSWQSGACKLTLHVSATRVSLARNVQLHLRASAPEGWHVAFPDAQDKLGDFTVEKRELAAPQLFSDGKHAVHTLSLTLTPFLAGDYTIPEQVLSFTPPAVGGVTTAQAVVLKTEAVRVRVEAVIPPGEKSPALRDIVPPQSLPTYLHLWVGGAAGLALLLGLFGGWLYWRKRATTPVVVLTAQELALRDLEELVHSRYLSAGQVKEFYLALSDVLRQYIENRFHLAAPERTTEEFLEELRSHPVLNQEHTHLLREFLRHCDMVKFARHTPVRDEINASVESCREFIIETPPEPVQE